MFGKEELANLRKVYNSEHPKEPPIPEENIWEELQKRFQSKCKSARTECIIAHMLQRPKAPNSWITNPTEWLSSSEIENVEKEYEKLFIKYKFLGCIPIDFDLKSKTGKCLVDALCSINLKDLEKQGKRQIGIVFNTDIHTGPGQHWMCVFCDLDHPRITYFDSYAKRPEKEIQILMKRWKEQFDGPMETTYNTTKHQSKDTECGMYCLYFHYCCLNNISMEERVPDETMVLFRQLLFRRE